MLPLDIIQRVSRHVQEDGLLTSARSQICAWVAASGDPASPRLLVDPYLSLAHRSITPDFMAVEPPTFAPPPTKQAQTALKSICLVSKQWRTEARPFLWNLGIRFGMPRGFETVVKILDPIGELFDGGEEPSWLQTPQASRHSSPLRGRTSMSPRRGAEPQLSPMMQRQASGERRGRSISMRRSAIGDVVVEEDGGVEGRSVSPPRGRSAMQALSVAFRHVSLSPGPREDEFVFRPDLDDKVNPGPFISIISWSAFRTQGLKRTVGEGSQVRFVTAERVLRLFRATRCRTEENEEADTQDVTRQGKLRAVGFSEYMDSAISQEVLEELLFRGGVLCHYEVEDGYVRKDETEEAEEARGRHRARDRHPPIHGRRHRQPAAIPESGLRNGILQSSDDEPQPAKSTHQESRFQSNLQDETPVVAIDFCACTSKKFSDALGALNDQHSFIYTEPLVSVDSGGPGERFLFTTFPHLRRLGLFNVAISTHLLTSFVLRCTGLTHLDLTGTRAGPLLLKMLQVNGVVAGMRLKALSLGRCRGLTEDALLRFFCGPKDRFDEEWKESVVISDLTELSLAGDPTQPTPITLEGASELLQSRPFASGQFVSLDLSSIPFTNEVLLEMASQPRLIQLGLGSCMSISLAGVAEFLETRAPGVEVLDLSGSCGSSRMAIRMGMRSLPPLSTPDLHTSLIDVIARPSSFLLDPTGSTDPLKGRKTALRVVELEEATLNAIQGGANGWKVAWGKGQRGWYVDTNVTVDIETDTRTGGSRRTVVSAKKTDPRRQALEALIKLNGIVPSDMGWFSKKMEILENGGFLARQEGLYAFHAYARR